MTRYVLKIMMTSIDLDGCEYSTCNTVTTEDKQAVMDTFNFFVMHYQKFSEDVEQVVVRITLCEITPDGSKGLREFNITKG